MNDNYRDYDDELEDIYDEDEDISDKYIIVQILDSKFGFKIENVKEITVIPECKPTPEMREYERGIIKLRNDIIKVIDLRKRLKYKTIEEEDKEFLEMMEARKQEHIHWMEELTKAVFEKREPRIETDPNKCTFGRWYNSFEVDSITLSLYLVQMNQPHKQLHNTAVKVKELQERGLFAETFQLLEEVRTNDFKNMIDLFENFAPYLKEARREIILIFESNGKLIGLSADKVHSIVTLPAESIEAPEESDIIDYISGMGKLGDEVYILLDEKKLIK